MKLTRMLSGIMDALTRVPAMHERMEQLQAELEQYKLEEAHRRSYRAGLRDALAIMQDSAGTVRVPKVEALLVSTRSRIERISEGL